MAPVAFFFGFVGTAWLAAWLTVRPNVRSRLVSAAAGLGVLVSGVLLATYVMVSAVCTPAFPMHLFENGQCLGDTPYEEVVGWGLLFTFVVGALFIVALFAELARARQRE
jgi:hypothetical protein